MGGSGMLLRVFCAAVLLAAWPSSPAAWAGEEPGWMKALQKQMEAMQKQMEGARPERPDLPAPPHAAADGGVTLAIDGADAALLPRISVFLEEKESGERFPLTRRGSLFQGGTDPGIYLLHARIPGVVPFAVNFGPMKLQPGASIQKKLDLKAMLASLRIEAADPQLLQGASLWIYRGAESGEQPLARIRLRENQPIEGVPAGRLRLVLRDPQGAALFQQSIRPFPGREFVVRIKEAHAAKEAQPLRLWVRNQTGEPFPEDLQAEVFDSQGKRVTSLAKANEYQFAAPLAPGVYELKVKRASGRRGRNQEVVVGDAPRPTDVVVRLERHGPAFCSGGAVARAESLYRAGGRQEKGGDPAQALLFYHAADRCLKNEAAREALQRVGRELGRQAEAAGHYYGERFYRTTPDQRCVSPGEDLFCTPEGEVVQFDPQAPAVAWYAVSHNDDLAAQAMLRYAEALPVDGWEAFQSIARSFGRDEESLRALKAIAAAHGQKALDEENGIFTPQGGPANLWSTSPEDRSLELLEHAGKWCALASQGDRVMSRAAARGDALMASPDPAPRHFEAARRYYQLAGSFEKMRQVQAAAARAGERAAGGGEYQLAAGFFTVAGDDRRAAAMERQAEQAADQEGYQSEEERATFEDGADALEKELGI